MGKPVLNHLLGYHKGICMNHCKVSRHGKPQSDQRSMPPSCPTTIAWQEICDGLGGRVGESQGVVSHTVSYGGAVIQGHLQRRAYELLGCYRSVANAETSSNTPLQILTEYSLHVKESGKKPVKIPAWAIYSMPMLECPHDLRIGTGLGSAPTR